MTRYTPRLRAALALQRAVGSRVGAHYADLFRLERLAADAYRAECERRLERTLAAARTVPFYRDRVAPGASLTDFPVLTKQGVRDEFDSLVSPTIATELTSAPKGYGWIRVQTGGTTGSPTTVIHDRRFRDAGRAARLYSQYLSGFVFGTPHLFLWGSMRDINAAAESLTKRIQSRLANQEILNAFQMDDAHVEHYLARIMSGDHRYLMAYVDAARELARVAVATGREGRWLSSVMACAGTVTADTRSLITQAFGARVHDKYGSRECSDMACECDQGGFHVYAHHVHLEVVDSENRPVRPGEVGRLLVTLLGNDAFPMIRYEIGDLARAAEGSCGCGRPMPLIGQVEGRSVDVLTNTDGEYVSPVYLRHLIGVVHNPKAVWRRFQVVQEGSAEYRVLLEPVAQASPDDVRAASAAIDRDLRPVLGHTANIDLRITARIPESDSGKFLYVRNDFRRATERVGA